MLKLFGSQNLTAGSMVIPVPKSNYKAFIFEFAGTASNGETVTTADLGSINIQRDGETICNVDVQDLVKINNAESGLDRSNSTISSTFNFSVCFNLGDPDDRNFAARYDRDKGLIQVNFGAVGAKIASGLCSVYGDNSKGVELYYYKLLDFSQQMDTTGSQISPLLNTKNVQVIYFRNASDVSSMQITKDNYALSNATGVAFRNDTQRKYHLESDIDFIYLDLNQTKQVAEVVSSVIQFNIISGKQSAGSCTLLYKQVVFDVAKAQASINSARNFNAVKLPAHPAAQAVQKLVQVSTTA